MVYVSYMKLLKVLNKILGGNSLLITQTFIAQCTLQLITQNQERFVQMLNEANAEGGGTGSGGTGSGGSGSGSGSGGSAGQAQAGSALGMAPEGGGSNPMDGNRFIQVTPDEKQAIERVRD